MNEHIRDQLIKYRTERNITIKRMSELIGVSRLHYSRIEYGKVPVSKNVKLKFESLCTIENKDSKKNKK